MPADPDAVLREALDLVGHDIHAAFWGGVAEQHNTQPGSSEPFGDCYKCRIVADKLRESCAAHGIALAATASPGLSRENVEGITVGVAESASWVADQFPDEVAFLIDAAWEALAADRPMTRREAIARHRPDIEAAILVGHATASPGLDAARLADAMYMARQERLIYDGITNRDEAVIYARKYAALAADRETPEGWSLKDVRE